jgi:hypothetical protein
MPLHVSSTCAHHQEVKIVFNQLDAQNLFYNKFYFMHLHVSSTCAHHQEVKIVLHSIWYHHTYRWPSGAQVEGRVLSQTVHRTATYRCDDTRCCVMQFWPPDDEHVCSEHVEALNKAYCETNILCIKLVNYWDKLNHMLNIQIFKLILNSLKWFNSTVQIYIRFVIGRAVQISMEFFTCLCAHLKTYGRGKL